MDRFEKIDRRASNEAVLKCILPLNLSYVKEVLTGGAQYIIPPLLKIKTELKIEFIPFVPRILGICDHAISKLQGA